MFDLILLKTYISILCLFSSQTSHMYQYLTFFIQPAKLIIP